MKESLVNLQRSIVAHHQSAEVAEPCEGAFHGPASPISAQRPTVLRRRLDSILAMRGDQLDAACRQFFAQRVTIVALVGDEADGLLPRTPGPMFFALPESTRASPPRA